MCIYAAYIFYFYSKSIYIYIVRERVRVLHYLITTFLPVKQETGNIWQVLFWVLSTSMSRAELRGCGFHCAELSSLIHRHLTQVSALQNRFLLGQRGRGQGWASRQLCKWSRLQISSGYCSDTNPQGHAGFLPAETINMQLFLFLSRYLHNTKGIRISLKLCWFFTKKH